MPFQPVPEVAQAVFRYVSAASGKFIGANVLHFEKNAGGMVDGADLEALGDVLGPWWETSMQPIQSVDCVLNTITMKGIDFEEAPILVRTINGDGQQVGDRLGAKTTIAVAFKTGFTGRSLRGRAFQVGMVETQVVAEVVTTAFAGALIDAWEALKTALETDGTFTHVVVSRFENGAPRTVGMATPVTQYVLTDLATDVQKDRG